MPCYREVPGEVRQVQGRVCAACIGPAHRAAGERLSRAQRRESARFVRDYNDRIFNGLVIACLADILVFRFLVRISLMETVGWVAFAFLQARSSPLAGLP